MYTVVEPGAHDHDILVRRVGASQNISQIVEILGITHCHQDVPWPNPKSTASQFLVSIYPELPEAFRLALALARNSTFRIGEEGEEKKAEGDAAGGGWKFVEKVDYVMRNGPGKIVEKQNTIA